MKEKGTSFRIWGYTIYTIVVLTGFLYGCATAHPLGTQSGKPETTIPKLEKRWAADWKHYATDSDANNWFYDTQSISRGQDTLIVRTKEVLSDNEKADFIKEYPHITNIKNISYILDGSEINCSKNIRRPLSSFWYSSEGYDIYSVYYSHSEFNEVVPDSTLAELVEIICKEGGKENGKD
jgi:hypothetical protein